MLSQLPPAYRGAPYRQPPRLPRKQRATRIMIRLAVAGLALLLIGLIGAAVAPSALR